MLRIPINLTTFELRNVETAQSIYFDSVVVDSGQRVIVAYGEDNTETRIAFEQAHRLSDSLWADSLIVWVWQTGMILGDSSALLQLFEGGVSTPLNNRKQIDKLQYGSAVGRTAENDDSTHYALKRDGYEQEQNQADLPEYSKQAGFEDDSKIPEIRGNYVLREIDLKRYELKDHLSNVRVIVSDVKESSLSVGIGEPLAFEAIIRHYASYYAFGMEKPAMVYDKGSYRYGYQEQEMDNEIQGIGNAISYKYRVEDSRTGRFFSIDPLAPKYAYNSPYAFSENRVIDGVELEGLEWSVNGNIIKCTAKIELKDAPDVDEELFKAYQMAIIKQFNDTFSKSSNGKINGELIFDNNAASSLFIPSLSIGRMDPSLAGCAGVASRGSLNPYNYDGSLKTPEVIAMDAVHELFHTIGLSHPHDITQVNDMEVVEVYLVPFLESKEGSDQFALNYNIMEYRNQIIDGVHLGAQSEYTKYKMEYLSQGQLNFIKDWIKIINDPESQNDPNLNFDSLNGETGLPGKYLSHKYVDTDNKKEMEEYKAKIKKAKE